MMMMMMIILARWTVNPCNEHQFDDLFILSLFRPSTSTCFVHISSPSSAGILYIYNWYVLCFLVDCLLAGQQTVHQVGFRYMDLSRCTVNKTKQNKKNGLLNVRVSGVLVNTCCLEFKNVSKTKKGEGGFQCGLMVKMDRFMHNPCATSCEIIF